MKRYVYDIDPEDQTTWVRLRDNGEKTTLTIKEIKHSGIDGTKELEIDVGDFEKANQILNKLKYSHKGYQENKRISYKFKNVEIEIDLWPKIPPYVEFEGKSIEEIEEVVKLLGFEMENTTTLCNMDIYKKYGINLNEIKELKFL
jgi:adenylate cyclase, class 2